MDPSDGGSGENFNQAVKNQLNAAVVEGLIAYHLKLRLWSASSGTGSAPCCACTNLAAVPSSIAVRPRAAGCGGEAWVALQRGGQK